MSIIDAVFDMYSGSGDVSDGEVPRSALTQEFVTDEEKVVHLLARHGGYTWQGDVVTELDWSESKTSRTLSRMEEEDRVTRYQIGRRNVVCLPHREPEQLRRNGVKISTD